METSSSRTWMTPLTTKPCMTHSLPLETSCHARWVCPGSCRKGLAPELPSLLEAPASWNSLSHFTFHNISFKFPAALKPKGLAVFPCRIGAFPPVPAQRCYVSSCPSSVKTMDLVLGLPTSLTCCQHPKRAQLQWEQDVREGKCPWKTGLGFPVMYLCTNMEKNSVCLLPFPLMLFVGGL